MLDIKPAPEGRPRKNPEATQRELQKKPKERASKMPAEVKEEVVKLWAIGWTFRRIREYLEAEGKTYGYKCSGGFLRCICIPEDRERRKKYDNERYEKLKKKKASQQLPQE